MNFSVLTSHPVAIDSLDHIYPCGAARDNSKNELFNQSVTRWLKENRASTPLPYKALDIGCAGGAFVKSLLLDGWEAVGIEGSDYPLRHDLFHWPELYNKNLFTADACRLYKVQKGDVDLSDYFDLITAWEVLEHVHELELWGFLENIHTHLSPSGIFCCSISSVDCPHGHESGNVDLHVTQKDHDWWVERFKCAGFDLRDDINEAIGPSRVRYGDMRFLGPQHPDNRNPRECFSHGNYVFTKREI
jgi:SAM-dependent methyltransferase